MATRKREQPPTPGVSEYRHDSDYDCRTFCVTQAFFPDRQAWDRIARALKGTVELEAWEALSGTTALPFRAGKNGRVAVKGIDPRGNEVMRVHRLDPEGYRRG
jgi:adenine-specific DNA-methyltransferase